MSEHPFSGLFGGPGGHQHTAVQKSTTEALALLRRAVQVRKSAQHAPGHPFAGMFAGPRDPLAEVGKSADYGPAQHPMSGMAGAPGPKEGGEALVATTTKNREPGEGPLAGLFGSRDTQRPWERPAVQTVTKTAPELLETLREAVSLAKSAPQVGTHPLAALGHGPAGAELGLRPDVGIQALGKNLEPLPPDVQEALDQLEALVAPSTKSLDALSEPIKRVLKALGVDSNTDPGELAHIVGMLKELFSSAKSLGVVEKTRELADLAERLGGRYSSGHNPLTPR